MISFPVKFDNGVFDDNGVFVANLVWKISPSAALKSWIYLIQYESGKISFFRMDMVALESKKAMTGIGLEYLSIKI